MIYTDNFSIKSPVLNIFQIPVRVIMRSHAYYTCHEYITDRALRDIGEKESFRNSYGIKTRSFLNIARSFNYKEYSRCQNQTSDGDS